MHSTEIVDFDGPTLLALWEFRIGRYGVDDMNLVCVSLEENYFSNISDTELDNIVRQVREVMRNLCYNILTRMQFENSLCPTQ